MRDRPEDQFTAALNVSRETLERLAEYANLIAKWTPKINLVSRQSLQDLWRRHFLDSAQLYRLTSESGQWVDLGSGGGFPGMVIAILAAQRDDLAVILVEADQRKAAFLRTVNRELGLQATIIAGRIETIPPIGANVLSARALAPLDTLLSYADRHLAPGGRALFPKGAKADAEITEALEHWRFDCEKYRSMTDETATILSIGALAHV